jgi:uncharacterized protein (DUF58 family)
MLAAALPLALGGISGAFVVLAALVIVIAVLLAIIDVRATPSPGGVPVARVADPQLSIGVPNRVTLRVTNPFARPLRLVLADSVPVSFDVDHRRSPLTIAAHDKGEVAYAARPHHRGSFSFGDIHLRLRGPLDLIERQGRIAATAPGECVPRSSRDPPVRSDAAPRPRVRRRPATRARARRGHGVRAPP